MTDKPADAAYYILDADRNPVRATIDAWGVDFMENDHRVVGRDEIGEADVYTVFVGFDSIEMQTRSMFTTSVYAGEFDGYEEHTETWAEAEAAHRKAVEMVKKGKPND